MFPSGPAVIAVSPDFGVSPSEYSVTAPSAAIRPILFPANSTNHIAPSGPGLMSRSCADGVKPAEYSVIGNAATGPMALAEGAR